MADESVWRLMNYTVIDCVLSVAQYIKFFLFII